MPVSPLTRTRTQHQLTWLFPRHRFLLKELQGQCAVWVDNNPQASYVGESWEDVMKDAVKEAWKE